MKDLAVRIYDFLSGRRWLAALLLALLLGLSAVLISRMHYDEDISAFLPSDEKTARYREVYAKLGGQDRIAVLFSAADDADVPDAAESSTTADVSDVDVSDASDEDRMYMLMDAMDSFAENWTRMDSTSMVGPISSSVDRGSIFGVFDFISSNWPYFLTDGDYERMDSLLACENGISERLVAAKRTLSGPVAAVSSRYLRTDPVSLFLPVTERLSQLNPTGGSNVVDGYLFTADSSTGVIFFKSPFGGSESGSNSRLVALLDEVTELTIEQNPGVSISSVGGPIVAAGNAGRIRKDSIISVSLALLLILLVLYFSYRRFSDVLWIALSILCGAAFALGFIALFKTSISVIVLGIGAMVIGVAVNYPLHYIDHLKYQPDKRKALREQVTPLVVGNLTTVGAFLGLLMMSSGALRDFGLVGALTLVGTMLFVLVFLPVFAKGRSAKATDTLRLDLDRHINPSPAVRKLVFAIFVILTAVFIFEGRKISFDSDLHNINYLTPEQSRGFAVLESMGADSPGRSCIYAVSEASDADSALENAERLAALAAEDAEVQLSSICDFVPSLSEQGRRLERWERFRAEHPTLADDIRSESLRQGFSETAFNPFYALMEKDFVPRSIDYFEPLTSTIGQSMVLRDDERTSIVSYLRTDGDRAPEVKARLSADAPQGSFCFDASDVSNRLAELLSADFDLIGMVCSLIVFVFLWLSFRRIELSLLAFLPLAAGWAWILGIMQICGLQFNIVNIILATFIFGMGDDYTIFITEGLLYERATGKRILMSYKNSVVLSAVIMFLGIGVLVIARHPAMRSVGLVTVIGMSTVVMMACYLPPIVFRLLTRKGDQEREFPLTLGRILRSLGAILFFLLACVIIVPAASLYFMAGPVDERKKLRYHRFLQRLSAFIVRHVPGTRFSWSNPHGEDFSRPAVMISNHQSHLDVMAAMMLTPKLIIMTNDWVWNNPFYGKLIHLAEFYPASDGYDRNLERLKGLVERGYSILVFPEGTRNPDCRSVQRFHRGAFTLAASLGLDVLPLYIHGFGDVLPKTDFMLRRGQLYLEVGERVPAGSAEILPETGEPDWRSVTRAFHALYVREYARIRREREDALYWAPYVRGQYLYKGAEAEAECARAISASGRALADAFPQGPVEPSAVQSLALPKGISLESFEGKRLVLSGTGCGAWALLLALTHKNLQIETKESDEDRRLIASGCHGIPDNLHIA